MVDQVSAAERCTLEGCTKPRFCKGMCQMHYRRTKRGQPLEAPPLRISQHARVEALQALREAALSYADADASRDEEFTEADRRLVYSALRLARRAYWPDASLDSGQRTPFRAMSRAGLVPAE